MKTQPSEIDWLYEPQTPEEFPGVTCQKLSRQHGKKAYSGTNVTGNLYHREFDSFAAFLDFCQTEPRDDVFDASLKIESGRNRFCESETFEDALEIARHGWDEGRKRVLEIKDEIETGDLDTTGERIAHEYGAFGQRLDVGRYMGGDPDCWASRSWIEDEHGTGGDEVTIFVNVSGNHTINRESFKIRGAAVAAAAEIMEWLGISVRVIAGRTTFVSSSSGTDFLHTTEVPVKRRQEPVNPDVLSFQLANPDMLRRLMFALNERERPEIESEMTPGYGASSDWDRHVNDDSIIYVGALGSDLTVRDGKEWLIDTLEEQGIEIDNL